jgi:hypothetical protein
MIFAAPQPFGQNLYADLAEVPPQIPTPAVIMQQVKRKRIPNRPDLDSVQAQPGHQKQIPPRHAKDEPEIHDLRQIAAMQSKEVDSVGVPPAFESIEVLHVDSLGDDRFTRRKAFHQGVEIESWVQQNIGVRDDDLLRGHLGRNVD